MTSENPMLTKISKLLAKAEAQGCSPQEAEALTAKAADLMAKYGVDRAMLAANQPETDHLTSKTVSTLNPWGKNKGLLLYMVAEAMRCKCIMLSKKGIANTEDIADRVMIMGWASDIERAELMYTSLLLQMSNGAMHAQGSLLDSPPRAFRHSWMLGFITSVAERIKAAEKRASEASTDDGAPGTELVLADRSLAVRKACNDQFRGQTKKTRRKARSDGYSTGFEASQRADIGGTRIGNSAAALR